MTEPRNIDSLGPARRAALLGALGALALVAGYVEALVPLPVAIPGVKLGLGNAVVLYAALELGPGSALALMAVKVLGSVLLFASPQTIAFSLAGGIVSWAVMCAAVRSGLFSIIATSVLGGLAHDAGQLAVVALLLSPRVALANAPVLAVAGAAAGALVGVVVRALVRAVPLGGRHG